MTAGRGGLRLGTAAGLALAAVLAGMPSSAGEPPSVRVIEKEFLFLPKDMAAPTGEIAFDVKNTGSIEHNLVLQAPGGENLARIDPMQPGESRRFTASLPPGVYILYCSLPGHREAGMSATLRVQP